MQNSTIKITKLRYAFLLTRLSHMGSLIRLRALSIIMQQNHNIIIANQAAYNGLTSPIQETAYYIFCIKLPNKRQGNSQDYAHRMSIIG